MFFKSLRRMESGELRKNRELKYLYKDPAIIALVKSERLRWQGHDEQRRGEHQIIKSLDRKTIWDKTIRKTKMRRIA